MKQIFINIPVSNLNESLNFYLQLGFSNKSIFSDSEQKCMVWSNEVYVMLLSMKKFLEYARKQVPDMRTTIGAYYTLHVTSQAKVDEVVERGLSAGGKEPIKKITEPFMTLRRIEDPDGNTWDIVFMDESKFQKV